MANDFKEDLKIDKYSLDKELVNQPSLFIDWAEKTVEMEFKRDSLKDLIEVEKAILEKAIRANPDQFGISKITEKGVLATIITNKEIMKLSAELLEISKQAKLFGSVKTAFDHRMRSLEKLTTLNQSGYYSSSNKVVDAEKKQSQEIKKEQSEALTQRRRRRKV